MRSLDPSTEDGAKALRRLETELMGWVTTVSPDGQPRSSPIWFLWRDGDEGPDDGGRRAHRPWPSALVCQRGLPGQAPLHVRALRLIEAQMSGAMSAAARAAPSLSTGRQSTGPSMSAAIASAMTSGADVA